MPLRCLLVAVLAAGLVGCSNERASPDNATFHSDVVNGRAGAEVTVIGVESGEPRRAGDHEHLLLLMPTGEHLEVDHNTRLAPWVPAHDGDQVTAHGQLYLDPGVVGIHCTHSKTSSGCAQAGWISLKGNYYE